MNDQHRLTFASFEVTYQDEGSDEVKVLERTSLMTSSEAARLAAAWAYMSWTPGRKFDYRIARDPQNVAETEKAGKIENGAT